MVPTEAGEIQGFTPDSLKNIAAPPVFKIRPAGRREWQQYQYLLRSEGLEHNTKEDFRDETLRALRSLYSEEQAQEYGARLRAYWTLIDQKGTPEPAELDAVNDLTERLARTWKPLARMAADNIRFGEESMKIAVSMFLVGWSRIDLPYRKEDGRTPLELLDELEKKLQAIEQQAIDDKVEGVARKGVAYLEIANACFKQLRITEDEEKNSSSPPPSPNDQSGSTKKRSPKTAAASSKASASSESVTA